MSYFSKVSSKGWIVIPKDIRDKYNIVPGKPRGK
jgi:AbrB family looped-hinge helix DNA binding protein